jgi:hypothetical protein
MSSNLVFRQMGVLTRVCTRFLRTLPPNHRFCRGSIHYIFYYFFPFPRSFKNLKIVSLMDSRVSNAGKTHDEIEQAVPFIEDLDLSRNLLASWFAVGEITCQLKHLRHLNLR